MPELPPQLVDRLGATAAELDVLLPTLDTCTDVDPMACPHAVREAERLAARLRSEVNPGPYTWSERENMRRAMDSLDRDVAAASTACLPEPADAESCRNAVSGIAFHGRMITYLLERLPA